MRWTSRISGPTGLVSEVAAQVYLNDKRHLMNNDNKPTAMANPHRTPPFAIDIDLPTSAETIGGRFHTTLTAGPLRYKLGLDTYRLLQSATQTIRDRDTGQIHHNLHPVWPDAEMTNFGGYAQIVYDAPRSTLGGTIRVDREQARVGGVTRFFADNAVPAYELHEVHDHFHLQAPAGGGHGMAGYDAAHDAGHHSAAPATLLSADHFGQNNVNVSAAANASVRITDTWQVNLGVGRAVRNPSVLERYADRFPAVKFQTAAEFVGNPLLVPEKSFEANAGTVLRVAEATIEADVFWRQIDDYITVAFDPSLSRRLPLSPAQVYRYVQADAARFAGIDLRAESAAGPWLSLRGGWSFVRGRRPAVRRAAVRRPTVRAAVRPRPPQPVQDALGGAAGHQHCHAGPGGDDALRAGDRRLDDRRRVDRPRARRRRDAAGRGAQPDRRVLRQPPELARSLHGATDSRDRTQRVSRTGVRLLKSDGAGLHSDGAAPRTPGVRWRGPYCPAPLPPSRAVRGLGHSAPTGGWFVAYA